ncbi:NADPH-dependent FMN reductase [Streptomyces sp. NBC_00503]|uniref:NADPH-dependent FMN reductase n=1 Tax=Streptomyces sp. NBC_00503 TaxID=2903659 RepID=UPI002E7FC688|nr:NADPH-dependent FMN reductase [Streptomyces sp. NBC_00503]WUD81954.1 NAD(P)H-dependent oxidoreductase [Streptomyces sp. NBC_00503]
MSVETSVETPVDTTAFKILAISGSLRADSHNTRLLHAARKHQPGGLDIEIYGGLRDIPPYDQDLDNPQDRPAAVTELRRRITESDGLLIATPEFNYSIPGTLKNAIDWVSTDWTKQEGLPLHRKPVAILGAAPTNFGTVRAQLALRQVFVWTDSDVVVKPEVQVFRSYERFDENGNLTDETTIGLVRDLLSALKAKAAAAAAGAR